MSTTQRLQKILASAGVASRRKSEELITRGRVSVNGEVVTELGAKADPERDRILVDGQPLATGTARVYLALFKPTGCVSTRHDPRGRRTVMDLAPATPGLHPVGRLDYDTSGLLLLTNDGDFTLALTHPRYGVPKTYEAQIEGRPSEQALETLRQGVRLEDGVTAPAGVERIGADEERTRLRLTIHEGRNRQVRRMLEAVGHPVIKLKRVAIGPVNLAGLEVGGIRPLSEEEIVALRRLSGHEGART